MSDPRTAGRRPANAGRPLRLAVFVSPHGFGHAARAAAILEALHEALAARGRRLEATLYTSVPRWFFAESLPASPSFSLSYRELVCDVGLVQRSAVEEDLPATVERLERFWTEARSVHLRDLLSELRVARADAVLCDIAPLGLLAAREAGLPAILVENFTWDWIYEPLVEREPRFAPWVDRMRELFALADLHLQAEPVCAPLPPSPTEAALAETPPPAPSSTSPAESPPSTESLFALSSSSNKEVSSLDRTATSVVRVPPIARRPRSAPRAVRERLGVAPDRPMILVSMGGVRWRFASFDAWRATNDFDFVVPGGAESEERRGNVVLLPHHSPVHHPDLVAAADVVVGKLGYSTVAEAHAAGARFLFPPRAGFREHPVLAEFVGRTLPAEEISLAELASGAWVDRLPALLARRRPAATPSAGAAAAAAAILDFLG